MLYDSTQIWLQFDVLKKITEFHRSQKSCIGTPLDRDRVLIFIGFRLTSEEILQPNSNLIKIRDMKRS